MDEQHRVTAEEECFMCKLVESKHYISNATKQSPAVTVALTV